MKQTTVLLIRAGLAAIVLGLWEGLPRAGLVDPELLPPFSVCIASLWQMLARPAMRADIAVTAAEIAAAFVIAVPVGGLIGLLIGESERLASVVEPLVFFLFGIPKSIFLPMFILTMGIGSAEKIAYGVFSTFLIVIMSAAAAVRSVQPQHLLVARSYGATRLQIAFRVYGPSMLPILLEGLRIAVIFTVTAVILAEMYAARFGIGHQIASWGENFQMPQLFAGVILLSAASIAVNEAIRRVEHGFSRWRA